MMEANMTLYTVSRNDGDNRQINLTAGEAADAILSHDGREWEMRRNLSDDGFTIWISAARSTWTPTVFTTAETEVDEAAAALAEKVIGRPMEANELFAEPMDRYEQSLQD
jgi:hypothetical protein